jgi:uncharacterized protein (TIGR00661 family)
MSPAVPQRVLVAPLNWGLGHATRCIPIIHELLNQQAEVLIASDGEAGLLLQKEFPGLTYFELPPYGIHYSRSGLFFTHLFFQLPKIRTAIKAEHGITQQIVNRYHINKIIADNRYGCYSHKIKSTLITHQLNPLLPTGLGWASYFAKRLLKSLLRNFSACWVPDFPDRSLSGYLSASNHPVQFIGPLSRLKHTPASSGLYDLLVILSGPEPQRSILETILMPQLFDSPFTFAVVRGKVESSCTERTHGQNRVVMNYAGTQQLQQLLSQSKIVIARSGYSTIMDLWAVQKKAILIPTPGQTEQEYLAANLKKQGIAFTIPQHLFNLRQVLNKCRNYSGFTHMELNDLLTKQIANLLAETNNWEPSQKND